MTKFQWEKELLKNLSQLPADERKRVLEYYDELFEDKYENGEREEQIISSFGKPSAIAQDIIKNYDGASQPAQMFETKKPPPQPTAPPIFWQSQTQNSSNASQNQPQQASGGEPQGQYGAGGVPLGHVEPRTKNRSFWTHPAMYILYAFLFIAIGIPVIATVFGLMLAVIGIIIGFIVGGFACIVYACIVPFLGFSAAQALATIGICLTFGGIGLLTVPLSVKLIKLLKKVCICVKNWFFSKCKAKDNQQPISLSR